MDTIYSADRIPPDTSLGTEKVRRQGVSILRLLAGLSVALISWTFPRIGFLKFSDLCAVLASPIVIRGRGEMLRVLKCYWLFMLATIVSLAVAIFMIGRGDNSLTSNKGLYALPAIVPFFTLARIIIYVLSAFVLTRYFAEASSKEISSSLRWSYYLAIAPGLLQIFRVYSGIHFNLPFFERDDVGPFSGVYNAGYLRLMGFDVEPLGYASSLIVVCCLSMFNQRRIPWLGMIVLLQTYSAGALLGLILAFIVSASKVVTRLFVLLYAIGFGLLAWWAVDHIQLLLAASLESGSVAERVSALYACLSMWMTHPLGVGLGLYGYFFNYYDISGQFPAVRLDWYPNNDPAMFLAYGGILYFVAYCYSFYYVLRRSRSYWLSVAIVALLFQSISSYLFFNPAIIVLFSLSLANSQPIAKDTQRKARSRLPKIRMLPRRAPA